MTSEPAKEPVTAVPVSEGDYVPAFLGHDWIGEHLVRDLEYIADELRDQAKSLDGKASLLHEQMLLAPNEAWRPPEGFVVVPREPTPLMIEVGHALRYSGAANYGPGDIYGAMITAALSAAPDQPGRGQ